MTDFSQALQHGAAHAWLFIPTAVLLGALHGLEPGHSKTMMAAFIVAIRGTITQAVLLGLSAAFSHSLVIWLLAAIALKYGSQWNAETIEPYFQVASAVIIAGLALWMFWRTRRDTRAAAAHEHHHHDHDHDHGHDDSKIIDTGHGVVVLSVFETGVPPVFRLTSPGNAAAPIVAEPSRLSSADSSGGTPLPHSSIVAEPSRLSSPAPSGGRPLPLSLQPSSVSIETIRPDGARQTFAFAARDGYLESTTDIPEPHEFDLTLTISRDGHAHAYPLRFEEHEHGHSHHHGDLPAGEDFQDAHEAAHALDIQKRFLNRTVTTPQIVLFGLTGGLLPCPAAFTVLIICMQVKQFTLGFALVAAFSFGLALTMVTVGAAAAWSVQHAQKKFRGFGEMMGRAPYFSCALLLVLAGYMAWHGWRGLAALHGAA